MFGKPIRFGLPLALKCFDLQVYERLGHLAVRRRGLVVTIFIALLVACGVFGFQVFGRLASQGYTDPGAESSLAAERIVNDFGAEEPFAVLVLDSSVGADDPAVASSARGIESLLRAEDGVSSVQSYWNTGSESLRSTDGKAGLVLVYSSDLDEDSINSLGKTFIAKYASWSDSNVLPESASNVQVYVGGWAAISEAITSNIQDDLKFAEAIAIPVTLVLLLFVFGSLVAAGLPLMLGGSAIVGAFFVLWVITQFTDVSVFALNLVTGFGLGLGIDYALLIINRFREELKRGRSSEDAVVVALSTAGRTVTISGLTVALTLSALLVFPMYFLRSFAMAGVSVVVMAVIASLTVLPAVLGWLGPRVDKGKVLRRDLAPKDAGMWATIARFVMRRPIPVALSAIVLLGFLALPSLSANFNQVDDRVLPATDPVAKSVAISRDRFTGNESSPTEVVLPTTSSSVAATVASAISTLPGIVRVQSAESVFVSGAAVAPNPLGQGYVISDAQRLVVISDIASRTPEGAALIADIRALDSLPAGTLVGGAAATYADSQSALFNRLPLAVGLIALATALILFLYTGSVLLPLKAIVLNLLSLSATLGVLTFIFQEGHLKWLVGDFVVTGGLDISTLTLIAVVAFGLSMDYEVFLLSRIKEEHDAGKDTTDSVALGLQRSGRIITAAAVLLAIVFATFVTAGVTSIKMLGVGVAFAILLDATVVRALLVPAFMRIAGTWNWWAPRPLRAIYSRFGLSD